MASSVPTTVTLSPICRWRLEVATRSTPDRFTRVILAPKLERIFNCANVLPLISGLVTKIRREINSLLYSLQSTFVGTPSSAVIASTSLGRAITNSLSPFCKDRKSTRLNSSHANISYAVFCLKKKNKLQKVTNTIVTKVRCAATMRQDATGRSKRYKYSFLSPPTLLSASISSDFCFQQCSSEP